MRRDVQLLNPTGVALSRVVRVAMAWLLLGNWAALVATAAPSAPAAAPVAPATPAAAAAQRIDVKLVGKRVAGGSDTYTVRQGVEAELHITSDKPLMLHLHGYEVHADVSPGKTNLLAFKATMPGRFPVHEHREGAGNHRAVFFVEVRP